MRSMRFNSALAAAAVLALAPLASPAAASDDPVVMLRVDVNWKGDHADKVKVSVPLSLIEVVVDSVDTTDIMRDLKTDKGIDIRKLWRELKNADVNEFVTIEKDNEKVKVYKDKDTFRVTVQEEDYDTPNVEIRIPFSVMDYMTQDHKDGFKLSEMLSGLKSQLPLTIVDARHDDKTIKVWLEEK
jgi:hypothetical protein